MIWNDMPIYNTTVPVDHGPDLRWFKLAHRFRLPVWFHNIHGHFLIRIDSWEYAHEQVIAFQGTVKTIGGRLNVIGAYNLRTQDGQLRLTSPDEDRTYVIGISRVLGDITIDDITNEP